MSVGVMKDYKLKQRNLRASHTLVWSCVYFQQNKKRRKPKVKIVTLQLCEVRKNRYSIYEKLPTCAD